MSKKLRAIGALSALAIGAIALASCSGGGAQTAPTGAIEGDIAYSFWGSPTRADKVNTVIGQFEDANSGVTVKPEVAEYLAYVERLTVRAAGDDLACTTGMQSTFFAPYADKGVLRPLDDLIKSGQIDTSDIPEDVMAAGQIDGKQYMIPTGTFVRLEAYNEELVKAAGVDAPTDDMSWEDWADWLHDLQSGLPDGVYASENEGGQMFTLTSWVIGHGQKMFDKDGLAFDKDLLKEYFQYWIDLADDGVAVPAASIPDQNGTLELTPIALGKAVTGTRDIPHLYIMEQALAGNGHPSAVKSVSMPSESDKSANVLGSNGIAIPESCDNVPTAAAYTDFFANDTDAALAFQSDNGIVTNTKAQDALLDDASTPQGVKRNITTLRGLTDAGDLTTTTYPEGLGTLTTELLRLYQSAAFGEISVDAAVDEFFTSAESALD
ncbi:ABC transporter substrate-binding protein [Microbacterium sp. B2969]|uniref:ABC transporter substrate-binding protein n=1 Tax=Microbacterium alkaliflavum TaxID=3248839 RepID=A0ABW7QES6_9MICO